MPKQRKKRDLPRKTCAYCGRPFTWRKKWAECWEDVKYCSRRCRGSARKNRKAKNNRTNTDQKL